MSITLVIGGMQEVRPRVSGWATTVVSAVGPHVPRSVLPVSFAGARHLVLPFRDTTDHTDPAACTVEMVDRVVAFAQSRPDSAERVVVHCAAGVGRSPAVAYVFLVAAGWSARDALAEVLRVRPQAKPNPLVIALADAVLPDGLWQTYERWARTTMWWRVTDTAGLGPGELLEALRPLKTKGSMGTPKRLR